MAKITKGLKNSLQGLHTKAKYEQDREDKYDKPWSEVKSRMQEFMSRERRDWSSSLLLVLEKGLDCYEKEISKKGGSNGIHGRNDRGN